MMGENQLPEERLKEARSQARELFERLTEGQPPEPQPASVADFKPEYLGLFLRALNSELRSAADEIRASSGDLKNLAAAVRHLKQAGGESANSED